MKLYFFSSFLNTYFFFQERLLQCSQILHAELIYKTKDLLLKINVGSTTHFCFIWKMFRIVWINDNIDQKKQIQQKVCHSFYCLLIDNNCHQPPTSHTLTQPYYGKKIALRIIQTYIIKVPDFFKLYIFSIFHWL